jgi:hypothetical protein
VMMVEGCAAKPELDVTYAGKSGFEGAGGAFRDDGGRVGGREE